MNKGQLVLAAMQEAFESLLQPEVTQAGEFFVIKCENQRIEAKAKEFGIDLDLTVTGRK